MIDPANVFKSAKLYESTRGLANEKTFIYCGDGSFDNYILAALESIYS
jgi:hypothetical protein